MRSKAGCLSSNSNAIFAHSLATSTADDRAIPCDANAVIPLAHRPCSEREPNVIRDKSDRDKQNIQFGPGNIFYMIHS